MCGRPKVGWQIDPFGHSRELAATMARLGFDGLFLGRIDYQDKNGRLNNQTAEMIWRTSANDNCKITKNIFISFYLYLPKNEDTFF